jgi:hypothetical protein
MATQQQSIKGSGSPNFPRGMDLLNRQGLNKGRAFTEEERSKLGLDCRVVGDTLRKNKLVADPSADFLGAIRGH